VRSRLAAGQTTAIARLDSAMQPLAAGEADGAMKDTGICELPVGDWRPIFGRGFANGDKIGAAERHATRRTDARSTPRYVSPRLLAIGRISIRREDRPSRSQKGADNEGGHGRGGEEMPACGKAR